MKLIDILREYESGELKSISKKSNSNISTNSTTDKNVADKKPKKPNNTKPIGTNTTVIDSAAKAIGTTANVLYKDPKKMSDYMDHMRAEIPDLDKLIQKTPRFINTVKKISPNAANILMKMSKPTNQNQKQK